MIYVESPRLHPKVFRDLWGLTNWETSIVLEMSERTVAAYCASANARSKRNPSIAVERLTYQQHQAWIKEGRIPPNQQMLPPNSTLLAA